MGFRFRIEIPIHRRNFRRPTQFEEFRRRKCRVFVRERTALAVVFATRINDENLLGYIVFLCKAFRYPRNGGIFLSLAYFAASSSRSNSPKPKTSANSSTLSTTALCGTDSNSSRDPAP